MSRKNAAKTDAELRTAKFRAEGTHDAARKKDRSEVEQAKV